MLTPAWSIVASKEIKWGGHNLHALAGKKTFKKKNFLLIAALIDGWLGIEEIGHYLDKS